MSIYLDHAATAGISDPALEAYVKATETLGNPSSLHSYGRNARKIVEDARESLAANLDAHPTEVVFTSGGTESNNLAVKGIFWARTASDPNLNVINIGALEHHSVLEPARWLAKRGAKLEIIPVNHDGVINVESINTNQVGLISVMLASNEIGTIEPISEVAAIGHSAKIPVHTDAVAALGNMPISFKQLEVDAMSIAAHKIGGPLGVGALLVKRGLGIEPLHHGGDQERGLRAGTINVPGVAAFAAALQIATENLTQNLMRYTKMQHEIIERVLHAIPNAKLSGSKTNRLATNVSFVFPGCHPDALLFGLDNNGIAASVGAACAAGVAQPSEALLACGFTDDEARASLRFTLGQHTRPEDVTKLLAVLPSVVANAQT